MFFQGPERTNYPVLQRGRATDTPQRRAPDFARPDTQSASAKTFAWTHNRHSQRRPILSKFTSVLAVAKSDWEDTTVSRAATTRYSMQNENGMDPREGTSEQQWASSSYQNHSCNGDLK